MNVKPKINTGIPVHIKSLSRLTIPILLSVAVIASLLLFALSDATQFGTRYAFGYGYSYSYSYDDTGSSGTTPETGTTFVYDIVTPEGRFTQNVIAQSADEQVTLNIPKDTIGKTKNGIALTRIEIVKNTTAISPPADNTIIGLSYDLGPSGATFNPPLTLTFKYNPSDIPSGVDEKNLKLAFYNTATNKWEVLENIVVNAENNTISGTLAHFTVFAVISPSTPVSAPTPTTTSTPTVTVTPTSTPEPTTSTPTSTPTSTSKPTVTATPPPTISPTTTPTQTATPTPTPSTGGGVNWWLWGIVIVVVIVIVVILVIMFIRRKR